MMAKMTSSSKSPIRNLNVLQAPNLCFINQIMSNLDQTFRIGPLATTNITSLAQLKNGFEQVLVDAKTGSAQMKACLRIVFNHKENWRMLIFPDWRLERLGQVEHQR